MFSEWPSVYPIDSLALPRLSLLAPRPLSRSLGSQAVLQPGTDGQPGHGEDDIRSSCALVSKSSRGVDGRVCGEERAGAEGGVRGEHGAYGESVLCRG